MAAENVGLAQLLAVAGAEQKPDLRSPMNSRMRINSVTTANAAASARSFHAF
jgi:hypothetical protein